MFGEADGLGGLAPGSPTSSLRSTRATDLLYDEATDTVSNTPGTTCDAISIGLGFDADDIQPPASVGPGLDARAPGPCVSPLDAGHP